MGVIDFEKNRWRAEMKLCKFAFPEEVTKKINQETLEVE
jgi:hypothetical protein